LVLHDAGSGVDLQYPSEAVINKPFTPREFLDAIASFSSGGGAAVSSEQSPFSGAEFEDDLIDSALGLDKIEVDDTKVLDDDTGVYRKQFKKSPVESMIGFEFKGSQDDAAKKPNKIESITVPVDAPTGTPTEPSQPVAGKGTGKEGPIEFLGRTGDKTPGKPPSNLSESSKIEIIPDQYGIISPEETAEALRPKDTHDSHDYEWFLQELQREAQADKLFERDQETPSPKSRPTAPSGSSRTGPSGQAQAIGNSTIPPSHSEAIDQFISEFKKEVDKITGDDANITVTNISIPSQDAGVEAKSDDASLTWEEGVDSIPAAQVRTISKEMIDAIARRVAEQLVARIDPQVVYAMIKDAIYSMMRRYDDEKVRRP